jgi:hypothetical protein
MNEKRIMLMVRPRLFAFVVVLARGLAVEGTRTCGRAMEWPVVGLISNAP